VLIRALDDTTNDWVSAAHALGMFGPDAASAIPRLTELKNQAINSNPMGNQGVQVMLEAAIALRKIDPSVFSATNETFSGFGISTVSF